MCKDCRKQAENGDKIGVYLLDKPGNTEIWGCIHGIGIVGQGKDIIIGETYVII